MFRKLLILISLLMPISPLMAFSFQGELSQSGVLYTGLADLEFRLMDDAINGAQRGSTDTHSGVTVQNGRFTVDLDLWINEFDGSDLWLEISASMPAGVSLVLLSPRQKLNTTPYAEYAYDGAGGVGTITAVQSGYGLTGGGTSGSVTLDVNDNEIQNRVSGSCAAGQMMTSVNQDGSINCEVDQNTTYQAGSDLTLNGSTFSVNSGAGNGLDADLLDGQEAAEIIAAANSEVRVAIDALPFTISQSGSYYLTQNLNAHAGPSHRGIFINHGVNDVNIDFMGFAINGNNVDSYGLETSGSNSNITIRNGAISNFGYSGIKNSQTFSSNYFIENMEVRDNGSAGSNLYDQSGIIIMGDGHTIIHSTVSGNTDHGIYLQSNSRVLHSTAQNNGGIGIYAADGSLISQNVSFENYGYGIRATGAVISNNTARNNQSWGFFADGQVQLNENFSFNNNVSNDSGAGGIYLGGNSHAEGNVSTGDHVTGFLPGSAIPYTAIRSITVIPVFYLNLI